MRRPFLQLILKEAKQSLGTALVFTAIIAGVLTYLISRVGSWPTELVFAMIISLVGFLPFWALWRTYYSLRQEWNDDHMYLLLSLPIPGWYITSSKLIVALVELLVYTGLIIGAALLVFNMGSGTMLPQMFLTEWAFISTAIRASLLALASLFIGMVVVQFSYLAARLVSRRRGLLMIALVFISTWAVFRLGGLLSPVLSWIPDIPMYAYDIRDHVVEVSTIYLGVAPLIGALLVSLILFWFGSNLLERDIEL